MIRLLSSRTNSMHYFTNNDAVVADLPVIIHEGDYVFFDTWRDIRTVLDFDTKKYLVGIYDDDITGTDINVQYMFEERVHVLPGLYSVDSARIREDLFFIKLRSVRHIENYHLNRIAELEKIKHMFKDDSDHIKEEK